MKRTIGALILLSLASCGSIPVEDLTRYRQSFNEYEKISEVILIDFAKVLDRARAKAEGDKVQKQKQPAAIFSTTRTRATARQPDDIEVRRLALRTIGKFNGVLTTLAEGKSVETVQNAAGDLVSTAGKFVTAATGSAIPGIGALVGLAKTAIAEFEKARLRKEFEKALRNGAPLIEKMFDIFVADIDDHFTQRADDLNLESVDLIANITQGTKSVRALFGAHKSGGTEDDEFAKEAEKSLSDALKPAEAGLAFKLPVTLPFAITGTKFGADQKSLVQDILLAVGKDAAKFDANLETYKNLNDTFNNYETLIEKARTDLRNLVSALDKPRSFESQSEEIFAVIFAIKKDIDSFEAARKAAKVKQ